MVNRSDSGRGRILFADDDAFFRELADATLSEAGFDVSCASGGHDAIRALEQSPCDLLILDLSMPDISGFEVLERTARQRAVSGMPVLVITGHDDTDSIARAFELGATSFLAKPLNWLLFVHHVKFVLKSARAQRELRDASRMAELMSDLKSRMVATLIGEVKSPLRSAYGFAKLLKEEADGPIASDLYKTWIGDLHSALAQLSAAHAKMLNLGRVLAEALELNEETVQLSSILEGAFSRVQDQFLRRNINFKKVGWPNDIPMLQGDRVLLEQAFKAVLENAVKFSPRGSDVLCSIFVDPVAGATISIDDRSPGFSAKQVEAILGDGLGSAGADGKHVDDNTGLKLARVFLEAHQGALGFRSVAGDGMRTDMRLPSARFVQRQDASARARLQALAASLQANSSGMLDRSVMPARRAG